MPTATLDNAVRPATQRQIEAVLKMVREYGTKAPTDEQIANWSHDDITRLFTWFRAQPKPNNAPASVSLIARQHVIVDGHYALAFEDDVRFYQITTDEEGDWAGIPLVRMFVSDSLVALSGAARRDVLDRVAADPIAASALYGTQKKRCGVCHRKLTVKASRELGIGPKCAARLGA